MKSNGYVKLHRQIFKWKHYCDPVTFRVFIHLLLNCNFAPTNYNGIELQPGQTITSIRKLAAELKLSERQIRTSFERLLATHEMTHFPTHRYTIITICKWEEYQPTDSPERHTERHTKRQHNKNIYINIEDRAQFYEAEINGAEAVLNSYKQTDLLSDVDYISDYKKMVDLIKTLDSVLRIEKQISFEKFIPISNEAIKRNVKLSEKLETMENRQYPEKKGYKDLARTLTAWVKREFKQ